MTREEKLALAHEPPGWMYEFDFGDGIKTPLLSDELRSIHETRERMLRPVLEKLYPETLKGKCCLDVACNEGFFSHLLYRLGACVKGIDIREQNILRARAVQRMLQLEPDRLTFAVEDFLANQDAPDAYDVTLFWGLLYHIENPMGAIRSLHRITKNVCIIESQLTRMKTPITTGWGQTGVTLELAASMALHQQTDTDTNRLSAASVLSFIPNAAAVRQMLFSAGFSDVWQVAGPPGSNAQYLNEDRGMFVALK